VFLYYIDILRATSTFTTLFELGVKSIRVFKEPEIANEYYIKNRINNKTNNNEMLLCGEINSIKPDNFYLGNSPIEYINHYNNDNNILNSKQIIFTSTNGAKIISHNIDSLKPKYKNINQFILSFLNIEENVNYLVNNITNNLTNNINSVNQNDSDLTDVEIILVCGGENGKISIEDTVCAIMFKYQILNNLNQRKINYNNINYSKNKSKNKDIELIEESLFVKELIQPNENINKSELKSEAISKLILKNYKEYIYQNSRHIERLKELKFEKDIEYCLELNKYKSVLILEENLILCLNH